MDTVSKKNVEEMIKEEILELRLDALRALYNACFKNHKNLTASRIEKIKSLHCSEKIEKFRTMFDFRYC